MDENPFPDLRISDTAVLDMATERVCCDNCGRKRMYFCYNCLRYLNGLDRVMPTVELPVKIDIIKHKGELDSKSTAVHAVLLAPEHCTIRSFPDIPMYNPDTDVLVFPSNDSITMDEWSDSIIDTGKLPTRAVLIDCTWNQIHPIIRSTKLNGLRRVRLNKYTTKFWRYNVGKCDSSYLATIEAIYFFLREFHTDVLKRNYDGEYDNLLMIFKYFYEKIRETHDGGRRLRAYKHRAFQTCELSELSSPDESAFTQTGS